MEPIVIGQEWIISAFNTLMDEYQRERDQQLKNDPNGPVTNPFHRAVKKVLLQVDVDGFSSLPGAQHLDEDKDKRDFNIFLLGVLFGQGLFEIDNKITLAPNPKDLI